jgi:hypothetical protein
VTSLGGPWRAGLRCWRPAPTSRIPLKNLCIALRLSPAASISGWAFLSEERAEGGRVVSTDPGPPPAPQSLGAKPRPPAPLRGGVLHLLRGARSAFDGEVAPPKRDSPSAAHGQIHSESIPLFRSAGTRPQQFASEPPYRGRNPSRSTRPMNLLIGRQRRLAGTGFPGDVGFREPVFAFMPKTRSSLQRPMRRTGLSFSGKAAAQEAEFCRKLKRAITSHPFFVPSELELTNVVPPELLSIFIRSLLRRCTSHMQRRGNAIGRQQLKRLPWSASRTILPVAGMRSSSRSNS